ncbi:tyrosine-type recombinase/integrase [Amnibacterium kyonggiense]|uniref:Site-specific recombinase XerD n=1 Tax=Amnibacterium kyonggiense TaxID=595671 RepID=A0A4R7FRK5_9MICO|nr:tyrosine-type recombinase/integrase [Amnibacterium kyonggiense]TDS80358.1 site-specific recombinase XerD [Amnibacterium kyonggiense]
MGTVTAYETAAGKRYRVRYRKPDHRQTDKRGFKTKREAELYLASMEVTVARGDFVDASAARATIGELGAVWVANLSHLKPSTERTTEIGWRLHVRPRWQNVPVSAVRHSDVQAWVSEMRKTRGATSVQRAYGVLASILDVAVADRRIHSNPARGVKLPRKVGREHRYLTHEQVSRLAVAAGEWGPLVLLLAYCGLRWGEAAGLRVQDVNLVRHRLFVAQNAVEVGGEIHVGTPKTHKRRSVPFPATLTPMFEQLSAGKGPLDLLFIDERGSYIHRSKTGKGWFWRAAVEIGLGGLTPHDLRHTAASLAVQSGANVKAVQRMLGHSSAAMTLDVYADLFDDDLDIVGARLDDGLLRTDVGKMWANRGSTPVRPLERLPQPGVLSLPRSGPRGARTHDPRSRNSGFPWRRVRARECSLG